ncbi:MAG: hypothetical protein HY858_15985 [Candidatus Solibacter usitatus]|nr:hypothetical protein [Candidatus Solibacter usitatus]
MILASALLAFLPAGQPPPECDSLRDRMRDAEVRRQLQGEIRIKPAARGQWDLALFNDLERVISIDVVWKELPMRLKRGWSPHVRDVSKGEDRGRVHGGFAERLEPRGCVLLRVRP